jgi:hypothetical protein
MAGDLVHVGRCGNVCPRAQSHSWDHGLSVRGWQEEARAIPTANMLVPRNMFNGMVEPMLANKVSFQHLFYLTIAMSKTFFPNLQLFICIL